MSFSPNRTSPSPKNNLLPTDMLGLRHALGIAEVAKQQYISPLCKLKLILQKQ